MSTHDDRSHEPRPVSRRGAIGRLFGLGAATVAAAALPAVAKAQPGPDPAPEPVITVPDWLADRPDWFLANVQRYTAALATLTDPLAPWLEGRPGTREAAAQRLAEGFIAGLNVRDDELDARLAAIREAPRRVAQDRIVTVRIPRLDRNERARLRRWLARLPAGERDPRVLYVLGYRGKHQDEHDADFLHVVTPAERSIMDLSPMDHAAEVVVAAGNAIRRPLGRTYLCSHQWPGESRAGRRLYEWPDGEITTYAVRRETA